MELPIIDDWVFYIDAENYKTLANPVKNALKKIIYNRNPITYDKRKLNHREYIDNLETRIENFCYCKSLSRNKEVSIYLFSRHLVFVDENKDRCLDKSIRYELDCVYNNYYEESTDTEEDTDYDD